MSVRLVLPRVPDLPTAGWRRHLITAIWWGAALTLAGIVFTGAFFVALRSEMQSTQVTIPELVGKDFMSASAEVEPLGLNLTVVDERNDPGAPSGQILVQDPPAGTRVKSGRKVRLVLSLGGRVLEVPAVVGQAAREVDHILRREGLLAGDEVRVPSRSAEGTVLAQVPTPATPAVPNSRVHRLVSDGPRDPVWVMPDLRGRHSAPVSGWLEARGFRVAVRSAGGSGQLPETVVGQLPLAGHPVRRGAVVELTVAQ